MFGVCYYPEHWPESQWQDDAQAMTKLGLRYVRIGEFAWSRLEPTPGDYRFEWLDRAIDVLNGAGLDVVLGTPTATPPKWLVDRYPEVLPVDPATGRLRGFGSRRHYDFSSDVYRREALRITEALARRYGEHDGIAGWQTDNELCCHDTTLSASTTARQAFRSWCRTRYGDVDELNAAWGNVFWSMEYGDFDDIELPVGAVTETSPAHQQAYRRFSSEQVVRFHREMVDVIREHSPRKFVTHNFVPTVDTGVDNFALAETLDFASYDNYPLGRTDQEFADAGEEDYRPYMRTGHPDLAAYYLDQTRGLGRGRLWIMEQQPGPVNWAHNNPRPAPGMIRFWTLEAFAHGAECVAYFRWRQVPFAQEQMHAGLLRPDSTRSEAWGEIEQAIQETLEHDLASSAPQFGDVAIVTAPESYWLSDIERQSEAYRFNQVQLQYYRALRELGLSVDFISPATPFDDYKLIVAPCLPVIDADFVDRCLQSDAYFVFGPRSGGKTLEFALPPNLPPGELQTLIPCKVQAVETLRSDCGEPLYWNEKTYRSHTWREHIAPGDCDVVALLDRDEPAIVRHQRAHYIGTLTDDALLRDFFAALAATSGLETIRVGKNLRLRKRGSLSFAFNYSQSPQAIPLTAPAQFLLGKQTVPPLDVAVWKT